MIIPARNLKQGGAKAGPVRETLIMMFAVYLATMDSYFSLVGVSESDRESRIESKLKQIGIPLGTSFPVARRDRAKHDRKWRIVRTPGPLGPKKVPRSFDEIYKADKKFCDKWLSALHIFYIAREKAKEVELGLNELASQYIKEKKVAGVCRIL